MGRDRWRVALARGLLVALALGVALRARGVEYAIEEKHPIVRLQAELDLLLNGAPGGTTLVVLEGGDAFVLPSDLARAGLEVHGGARVTIGDRTLVSLRSLAPAVAFEVDERALTLRITASPELLGRHALDLRPRLRPPDVEERFGRSAFLDYAADSDLAGHLGLSFEAGGRVGRWLATTGVTRSYDGDWIRGTSAAVRDDVPRLERLTVGDALVTSGDLGGSAFLGGISLAREFSLDPYLVRAPLPSTTAIVTAPSTMEVYVNGALVRQQALAPGYWDLGNLPAAAGQTAVRTVIRDAFGRERTLDSGLYLASGLLAPGLTDFGVAAGLQRRGLGTESFDYGPPAVVGRYRFGASEWLTPGVRAEASPDVASGGVSVSAGTRWGEVAAAAAASAASAEPGSAAEVSWLWLAPAYSFGFRLLGQSEHYATLSLRPGTDRPLVDVSASAGMTVSRFLGIGADLRAGHDRDLGPFASAGLRGSMQLGLGASLMVTGDYGRIAGGPIGLQLLVLLSWGRAGYSADASVNRDRDGRTTAALSTAKTLPRDTGYGYRFRVAGDDRDRTLDAALQGQTSFGRAELDVSRVGPTTAYHASAAGGLVYIDRRLFFSRPTENGFAIVDTGVPGVGVTLENGLVGRTGPDGILLVPDMQPYYASKLAIRDVDIPVEYEPGRTVRWVAPPLRGGSIVAFDVRRISAIAGQLVVRVGGEDQRPSYGELSTIVDGELRTSPVTGDGRFFLERVPPGKHVVQAVWRGGSCRAVVTLPADAPPVWDAGEVRCIPDALDPSGRIPSLRDPGYANELLPAPQDSGAGSGGR